MAFMTTISSSYIKASVSFRLSFLPNRSYSDNGRTILATEQESQDSLRPLWGQPDRAVTSQAAGVLQLLQSQLYCELISLVSPGYSWYDSESSQTLLDDLTMRGCKKSPSIWFEYLCRHNGLKHDSGSLLILELLSVKNLDQKMRGLIQWWSTIYLKKMTLDKKLVIMLEKVKGLFSF